MFLLFGYAQLKCKTVLQAPASPESNIPMCTSTWTLLTIRINEANTDTVCSILHMRQQLFQARHTTPLSVTGKRWSSCVVGHSFQVPEKGDNLGGIFVPLLLVILQHLFGNGSNVSSLLVDDVAKRFRGDVTIPFRGVTSHQYESSILHTSAPAYIG